MSTISTSFTATGVSANLSVNHLDAFTYNVSGTFVGTVILERTLDNGATFSPALVTLTAAGSGTVFVQTPNSAQANYRWRCSAFTSGTIVTTLVEAVVETQHFTDKNGNTILQINEDGIVVTGNISATGTSASSGVGSFPAGTVTDPSVVLTEPKTGWFKNGTNNWAFSANQALVLQLDTTGLTLNSPSQLFILKATNQMVIGTTNTTTVSFTAPAAPRVYTVPDAGGAASFVLTAGTQTIAGALTLSSTLAAQGRVGIGTGGLDAGTLLYMNCSSAVLSGTTQYGIFNNPVFSSSATVAGYVVSITPETQAASFTLPILAGLRIADANKGAASTITRQLGILINAPSQGTNNASITDNSSFTGNWFVNSTSTSPSQFAGLVGHIQSTNNVTDALPTQAEMVTALGAANQGTALVGFIKDANADTNYFICVSNGTSWYALKMTKGA